MDFQRTPIWLMQRKGDHTEASHLALHLCLFSITFFAILLPTIGSLNLVFLGWWDSRYKWSSEASPHWRCVVMWTVKLRSASAFHTVHLSVFLLTSPSQTVHHMDDKWTHSSLYLFMSHSFSKVECGSWKQVFVTITFSLPLSWAMWYLLFPPKSYI